MSPGSSRLTRERSLLLYVPPLQSAFHMRPLDARIWVVMAAWPIVVLAAEELRKAVLRRRGSPEALA